MSKVMQQEAWKQKFLEGIQTDTLRTDSDIEDFCEEFGVDEREAFRYLAELQTEYTECKGCEHIEFFGSGMYPCNCCRRGKKDYYVKSNEPKPFVGSKKKGED